MSSHPQLYISNGFFKSDYQNTVFLKLRFGDGESVVVLEARHGLEGSGFETRLGREFSHLSWATPRATHPPVQWTPGLFPGGKAAVSCR